MKTKINFLMAVAFVISLLSCNKCIECKVVGVSYNGQACDRAGRKELELECERMAKAYSGTCVCETKLK